ncbi:MAG: biotin carboxylase N-terminal domain-containing protein [Woeseiaceae bacterium]
MRRLMIANRGEIACRIMRTAQSEGIECVAVYSDIDANAMHVTMADTSISLGGSDAASNYLDVDKIIAAALETGSDAIHPGYGFLSENAAFADACEKNDIRFVGPRSHSIKAMGSKSAAKAIMSKAGVPLLPGYHGDDQSPSILSEAAKDIGYPVLLKAAAGGGGKGMRVVASADDFTQALAAAKREAMASFGDDHMLVEKYLTSPRHIELQVFADTHGNTVHLFDRDCSIQRRHQKIIEEAPAPGLSPEVRAAMADAAIAAAKAIDYVGAGTVEFLLDEDQQFYFMEMNTRLQVEHPVTEMITNEDLVSWQLKVADGQPLPKSQADIQRHGHALECRIYAEDPDNEFLPDSGQIASLSFPKTSQDLRVETGVRSGDLISVFYDPMIAKLVVHAVDRASAIRDMHMALAQSQLLGPKNNIDFLMRIFREPDFSQDIPTTAYIPLHEAALRPEAPTAIEWIHAAVAIDARRRKASPENSLWAQFSGWRMNATATIPMAIEHNDEQQQITLRLEDHKITCVDVGTERHDLVCRQDNKLLINDRQYSRQIVNTENAVLVSGLNGHFLFKEVIADTGASEAKTGDGNIRAPMTGKIVKIAQAVGANVTPDDTVIIVEAMKMEHAIKAGVHGTVSEQMNQEGDLVDGGQILMTIQPNAEG